MSEYAGLEFQLCLPLRRPTEEWFRALFQRLWSHGYSLHPRSSATASATWEAELEAPGCAFTLGDGDTETGSLATFIARATAESASHITISNGVSSLELLFFEDDASTDRADEHVTRLRYVALWNSKRDTSPPGKPDRPPYLHAYSAFVHTCALLCEALDPLYGIGYSLNQVRDDAAQDALAFFDTSVAPDLLAGRLPNASAWFRSEPFQYIAPAYVTPERTLTWLAPSGVSVQRLATGGLFVVPTVAPYTLEDSIAYELLDRGQRLALFLARAQHGQLAPQPTLEQLAQARREGITALTRASSIFGSINDREGEQRARYHLLELDR